MLLSFFLFFFIFFFSFLLLKVCLGSPLLSQLLTKMFGVIDLLCMTQILSSQIFKISSLIFFFNLVKVKRNSEYKIAESKGKSKNHFKKCTLDLESLLICC